MNYNYGEIYRYLIAMTPKEEDKYYMKNELDYSEDISTKKIKFVKKIDAIKLIYATGNKMGLYVYYFNYNNRNELFF